MKFRLTSVRRKVKNFFSREKDEGDPGTNVEDFLKRPRTAGSEPPGRSTARDNPAQHDTAGQAQLRNYVLVSKDDSDSTSSKDSSPNASTEALLPGSNETPGRHNVKTPAASGYRDPTPPTLRNWRLSRALTSNNLERKPDIKGTQPLGARPRDFSFRDRLQELRTGRPRGATQRVVDAASSALFDEGEPRLASVPKAGVEVVLETPDVPAPSAVEEAMARLPPALEALQVPQNQLVSVDQPTTPPRPAADLQPLRTPPRTMTKLPPLTPYCTLRPPTLTTVMRSADALRRNFTAPVPNLDVLGNANIPLSPTPRGTLTRRSGADAIKVSGDTEDEEDDVERDHEDDEDYLFGKKLERRNTWITPGEDRFPSFCLL